MSRSVSPPQIAIMWSHFPRLSYVIFQIDCPVCRARQLKTWMKIPCSLLNANLDIKAWSKSMIMTPRSSCPGQRPGIQSMGVCLLCRIWRSTDDCKVRNIWLCRGPLSLIQNYFGSILPSWVTTVEQKKKKIKRPGNCLLIKTLHLTKRLILLLLVDSNIDYKTQWEIYLAISVKKMGA